MKAQRGRVLHNGSSRHKEALFPSNRRFEPPYVGCYQELTLAEVYYGRR
jgi:hypothetical protein